MYLLIYLFDIFVAVASSCSFCLKNNNTKRTFWSTRHLAVCLFVLPADCQTAWVEARRTARTAAAAEGRGNSVVARPPLPLRRLRRQAAGWPAAAAGGPVAGAALAPETETEGKWGLANHTELQCFQRFQVSDTQTHAFLLKRRLFM